MYIRKEGHSYHERTPEEGMFSESHLVEEEGEGLTLLLEHMAESQEVPETFTAIDDYSDDDITLETKSYLKDNQITFLNALFMENNEWTEEQLRAIVENL